MPCSIVSYDHTLPLLHDRRQRRQKALIMEHYLFDDLREAKEAGMFLPPRAVEDWDAAKESFLASVEELFLQNACNSF